MQINNIPPVEPTPAINKIQKVATDSYEMDTSLMDESFIRKDQEKYLGKLFQLNDGKNVKEVEDSADNVVVDPQELQKAVDTLNKKLLGRDFKLKFEIHQRTGRQYVEMVDMQSGKVLKEIPSHKMLDVLGKIWDQMGITVDKKG
ncbi:flagellar protein FlaG [Latilactobacillus sp. VITA-14]|uniref:flagellar protein FlaG n=1 Tax=Latilactobacillus sp. VITA-14 TaxID=3367745 RepID=UPI003982927D